MISSSKFYDSNYDPPKGETVFISTGAGPVGSWVTPSSFMQEINERNTWHRLAIQIAKAQGLKVIGSAGSEEKVQFMKEIGADVAFNYKTTSTSEVLTKEGPIDMFVILAKFMKLFQMLIKFQFSLNSYWDNVGGETLDAALEAANVGARFIVNF